MHLEYKIDENLFFLSSKIAFLQLGSTSPGIATRPVKESNLDVNFTVLLVLQEWLIQ